MKSGVLAMAGIYLDYNASTPIDPVVAAAMRPFLEGYFGNPSSGHWAASAAEVALEEARGQVAALLGAENDEVIFTSGRLLWQSWPRLYSMTSPRAG